ncbi:unnamed protein product [Dicrocoelium dendriticum]|nr:unnamed protein product [Dicrocoelium dendriticum]
MSGLINSKLVTTGCILAQSQAITQPMADADTKTSLKLFAKSQESESESESETSSEDDDSSDEEKHMADNPILKERLKQLDRYATPIHCSKLSPIINSDANAASLYSSTAPVADCAANHTVLIRAKSRAPSEMAESSSTPSDYRCHQLSMLESPNGCSGPISLNASITPKHISPPYGIVPSTCNSDLLSQQEHAAPNGTHTKSINTFVCDPGERCLAFPYSSHAQDAYGGRICSEVRNIDNDYNLSCETCHSVFSTRLSLQNHMKKHSSRLGKRHQCSQCPYSTQYGKNLLKHVESMHSSDKTDQLRCGGCCRYFATEELLRNHECLLSQCNSYRCGDCGRIFKTKLRLKYHTDIHNPRKPYVCDVEGCDRAFRTPKYLKNHRDEFHRMQPKNYVCPVEGCDLIFHRKTHLKRHISTHDDAEKKYPCQWPNCQRRFCSEETLNLHYRKHTGEKPFNCALCPFSCYNKPGLNEHYRLQHAKDTNLEGPYKSFESNLTSHTPPTVVPRLQTESGAFGSQFNSGTHQIRTSTPVPAVRHRMVDILESCGVQQPGPLDAEINGILDSLDKESDLPDLFSSGAFDFEHSNPGPQSFENSAHPTSNERFSSHFDRSTLTTSESMSGMPELSSPRAENSESSECSLSSILTAVLAELQRADASGSVDEFERAKASAISLLPAFCTGEKLTSQIDAITDHVLERIVNQPTQVLKSVFHSSRRFTRDESYMVESLEHQLLTGSILMSPTPPRRRGRRPKLQQQLQPYLERIFSLEPSTAEAMAAHLLNVAQVERNSNHYDGPSNPGFSRGRGRGRGCRIRGRTTGALSLTLRLLPDGTAARAGHSTQVACRSSTGRGSIVAKRIRGIRGRYRIDRPSDGLARVFPSVSEATRGQMRVCESSTVTQFPSSVSHFDESRLVTGHTTFTHNTLFDQSTTHTDDAVDTSLQLRAMGRSSAESEEELDELEELDEPEESGDGDCHMQNIRQTPVLHHERPTNHSDEIGTTGTSPDLGGNVRRDISYKTGVKDSVSQDTLGEMLEDLGVIVKRIGERAAAKKQLRGQESPASRQPHNHIDYPVEEQRGIGITRAVRVGSDSAAPSIQLPSMATLASSSVGTPASTGGSTPGCLSNTELYSQSPLLSSVQSQHPTSLSGHLGSNKSNTPMSEVNPAGSENRTSDPTNLSLHQSGYKSPASEYHRTAPMWSCESMCCPTTHNCSGNINDMGSSACRKNETFSRPSDIFKSGNGVDTTQSYRPTDLSTRMLNFSACSAPPSPTSPRVNRSPSENETASTSLKSGIASSYSVQLSPSSVAMDSLMSAVEAVDHLRSLSALGAKYTASLGIGDGLKQGYSNQSQRLPHHHQYRHDGCSPSSPPNTEDAVSPIAPTSSQQHGSGSFVHPNMPSALNNLLCRERKTDGPISSSCGSPTKMNFLPQMVSSRYIRLRMRPV